MILEILFSVVIEGLFRLPGYYILRCFKTKPDVDFSSDWVALIGILFWVVLGGIIALFVWFL